ncbi:MAG: Gfo/Idh/MocA family oxidoreductase [Alphaproteobacteria bacterium]|nr:Gfo/Idh/MocA family oxidoreductase [Alphaproteobacteria bacterium]
MKHISGRRIRFGLVGCGRICANHINAIKTHSADAELVAVCDIDPVALAKATASTGAVGFASLTEMLGRSETDCIIVCTPSGLHPVQAIQIAGTGRHVMTEKPMATRWRDGLEMVAACDRAGVRLFVIKQNRFNPTLQLVRKAVDGGRFGRIYSVSVNVFWTRPQAYYDSAKWRGTWEFDGGAFMNQASHYIDLLDWLVGPLESVSAYSATLARNIEVEDTGVAALKWRNGALGTLNVTMLTYPQNLEGSLTILGETGTVRVGGVAVNEMQAWEFADTQPGDEEARNTAYDAGGVYGHGHPIYYENVIGTLRGNAEPVTDGREGLRSLELITALYKSARDGTRVALPLDN